MKLSVIIPVYNTEAYLRECLDSIINQTYKDLEIICIDDYSTDGSFEILKEYEQKDNRIKVFKNEKNLRVGPTRNRGIDIATGDYIHFMDSDDWLDLDAYEKLLNKIKDKDIDILTFFLRRKTIDGKKTTLTYYYPNKDELEKPIQVNNSIIDYWQTINATKIYKKSFLIENNLYYKDYEHSEDIYFCYTTLLKAGNIYITENTVYNYRCENQNSLSIYRCKNLNSVKQLFYDIYNLTKNTDKQEQICEIVFKFLFWSIWQAHKLKYIDYEYFVSFIKTINTDILYQYKHYKWHKYVDEILTKPKIYVIIKNNLRQIHSMINLKLKYLKRQ